MVNAGISQGGKNGLKRKFSELHDKVMKENKELVLRCKEFDIKLKTKESQCANLQLKATEDSKF